MDIITELDSLAPDEQKLLANVPVWLTLLAAYAQDGKISPNEKAESIKLAHLRTFTSAPELNSYYKMVDDGFESKLRALDETLPKEEAERQKFLEEKVRAGHQLLKKLDPDFAYELEKSLESFYHHIFNADRSFFQYFALPIISGKLQQEWGKYDFGKEQKK